jgi:hydrogenase assembly chaperone HypC/HupF
MCISAPGRIVELEAGSALVETAGRRRRAQTLLVPDVAIGDWVVVGAGSILRRLAPDEAASLIRMLDAARAAMSGTAAASLAQGDRP